MGTRTDDLDDLLLTAGRAARATRGSPQEPAGAHLDTSRLARFYMDEESAPAAAATREHLATCDQCRSLAHDVRWDLGLEREREDDAEDGANDHVASYQGYRDAALSSCEPVPDESATIDRIEARGWRARFRRRLVTVGSVAASLLIATIAGLALRAGRAAPTSQMLREGADQLASARPDLFAGFEPLSLAELAAGGAAPSRGNQALLEPRGLVVAPPRTFRWRPQAGVVSTVLTVFTDDGTVLWSQPCGAATCELSGDARRLEPGQTYIWRVAPAERPLALDGSAAFMVLAVADRRAFEAALAEVDARSPARVRDLLKAHLALRRGLDGEAERWARTWVESHPEDALGAATLGRASRASPSPPPHLDSGVP